MSVLPAVLFNRFILFRYLYSVYATTKHRLRALLPSLLLVQPSCSLLHDMLFLLLLNASQYRRQCCPTLCLAIVIFSQFPECNESGVLVGLSYVAEVDDLGRLFETSKRQPYGRQGFRKVTRELSSPSTRRRQFLTVWGRVRISLLEELQARRLSSAADVDLAPEISRLGLF